MTAARILDALELPPAARMDRRVPKKLLIEQAAPTAADRRHMQDCIAEAVWVAALKPANIAVAAFRSAEREYLEIAVLTLALRAEAKPARLAKLVHRAIPYPVLLLAEQGGGTHLLLAHKRWSQGEGGAVVLEGMQRIVFAADAEPSAWQAAFLASLAVSRQPAADLFALYGGWLGCVAAFEAARVTGVYTPPVTGEQAARLRESLDRHTRLAHEVATLRARAAKEKQLNRRVDLNTAIQALEAELASARQSL